MATKYSPQKVRFPRIGMTGPLGTMRPSLFVCLPPRGSTTGFPWVVSAPIAYVTLRRIADATSMIRVLRFMVLVSEKTVLNGYLLSRISPLESYLLSLASYAAFHTGTIEKGELESNSAVDRKPMVVTLDTWGFRKRVAVRFYGYGTEDIWVLNSDGSG
jgi:hypothetical protein